MKLEIKTADDLKAEAEARDQEARNAEARAYLADTDWYVVRQAETGEVIPEDISLARAKAREAVR